MAFFRQRPGFALCPSVHKMLSSGELSSHNMDHTTDTNSSPSEELKTAEKTPRGSGVHNPLLLSVLVKKLNFAKRNVTFMFVLKQGNTLEPG